MSVFCTQVVRLPADESARALYLQGVHDLQVKHGAEVVGGSHHDELSYLERLEKELGEHIGEAGVEDMRQAFEREQKKLRI